MNIETKIKYQYLRTKLYEIKNDLNELDNSYNDLEVTLKKNIEINNDIPERNELNAIQQSQKNINNEISSIIIPMINGKL